ncbi:hypothetical protein K2173_006746 [Erythroxylum novogranatense]|uniref:cytokinin dehydrogenase n=1 Tax=Erythroxylum novogranatense TaxID=1862640 RepID=A0AAV8T5M1_9ROSI|nr:hypothetical protein K2173_006746 [Erythroxylum novogranatense]
MILILFISQLLLSAAQPDILSCTQVLELRNKLRNDPSVIELASTDYGNIVHDKPKAVLYPSSIEDISSLIKSSYNCANPFSIATRGAGHSIRGQDMTENGVVVAMTKLNNGGRHGVVVSKSPLFADVGGEQLWIDVLNATLQEGYAPVSWTDYLYLSVGGTLSNAGISGQTFRFGPQISNVYELDVVTGKGELITCSGNKNSELFFGVLGGLGQFGVITRARIALAPAPKRVKWTRVLYTEFSTFTKDQESLIAISGRKERNGVDYLEGGILLDNGTPNAWSTSFFPPSDVPKILSLVKEHGIVYYIEMAKHYTDLTEIAAKKELEHTIKDLNFIQGFMFETDVSYVEFLTRVDIGPLNNETHPWLNLMIPRSRVSEFDSGVIRDILLKRNITTGPILFYPMNRNKWDHRMSAPTPDEDIFYTLALLVSGTVDDWQVLDDQNKAILKFLDNFCIETKQYLAHYTNKEGWMKNFGSKWATFQARKAEFDPKMILSPGQRIFN